MKYNVSNKMVSEAELEMVNGGGIIDAIHWVKDNVTLKGVENLVNKANNFINNLLKGGLMK